MIGGKVVMVDLHDNSWCSRTTAQPIEVEPGVFDFETNTSIYRFRLLTDEEEKLVSKAVEIALEREVQDYLNMAAKTPAGGHPLS